MSPEVDLTIGGDARETATFRLKKDPNDQRGKVVIITVNEGGKTIPAALQFGGAARDVTGVPMPESIRATIEGGHPLTVNARGFEEVNRNFLSNRQRRQKLKSR